MFVAQFISLEHKQLGCQEIDAQRFDKEILAGLFHPLDNTLRTVMAVVFRFLGNFHVSLRHQDMKWSVLFEIYRMQSLPCFF
jgi:hypothetical protein